MPNAKLIFLATLVAVGVGIAGAALAHGSYDRGQISDIASLADQANLVFIGRVSRVDYRMSRPRSKDEVALPHTVVTYSIQDVLRGEVRDKTFSMVFIGGSDGRGRFLDVSGVPQFQPGEQDLLFVTGNGAEGCALVHCEWGRFRILDGGVYNAKGSPVRAFDQNRAIARGTPPEAFRVFRYPAPAFDDLIQNPEVRKLIEARGESIDEARRRYQAEAPKELKVLIDVSPPGTEKDLDREPKTATRLKPSADVRVDPKSATARRADIKDRRSTKLERAQVGAIATTPEEIPEGPIAIEQFTATIAPMVQRVQRPPRTLQSFDPDAPIYAEAARVRAPEEPKEALTAVARPTREEMAELEAARERDFNPVLGNKR